MYQYLRISDANTNVLQMTIDILNTMHPCEMKVIGEKKMKQTSRFWQGMLR